MEPSTNNPLPDCQNPLLVCKEVTKTFATGETTLTVLSNLSLQVDPGEFLAITGESGCGKSTLLHLLGCLDDPTSGAISFQDRLYSKLRSSQKNAMRNHEFGFVFQFHHLLPEFNAIENIIIPGLIAGKNQSDLRQEAMRLLEELHLSERAQHKSSKLSGGEQQRVAVARAMINQPSILFMDEPTGNLDPDNGAELIELIRKQQKAKLLTVVIVTHNPDIADIADRHLVLHEGCL